MKTLREDLLVFGDLETTGLNPDNGHILEVGLVLADAATLNPIAWESWVVRPLQKIEDARPMFRMYSLPEVQLRADSYVLQMHTDNGLWDAVAETTKTLFDVGTEARALLAKNGVDLEHETVTFAGNGPDRFDRVWLRKNGKMLGGLDGLFHYRSLDISNVWHAFRKAGVEDQRVRPVSVHRALDDAFQSLEDWRDLSALIRTIKSTTGTKEGE